MSAALEALDGRRLVLVCGSGGVGKTTTSAALGLACAHAGLRVHVITVDPARRLADALGLERITAAESTVETGGPGSLSIAMLDTKAGWDELVRRHARDRASADRILANPLYDNITSRFVNSHDYIAMERLHDLGRDPRFDVVIVDTPPSRNALDLLDAPVRMREFFGGRLLRWLTLPYRSRALTLASRPFLKIADSLLGARFLGDIAEFFTLLQSMESGFVQRARAVEDTLRSEATGFVVVTDAEPAAGEEALFLSRELRRRGMTPSLVVVNKVVPDPGPPVPLDDHPAVVRSAVEAGVGDEPGVTVLLGEMTGVLSRMRGTVAAQSTVIDGFVREGMPVARTPLVGFDGADGSRGQAVFAIASVLAGS